MLIRHTCLLSLVAILAQPVVAATPRYTVTELVGLTTAYAINETGGIVGNSGGSAFLYSDGSVVDLGNLGSAAGTAVALDINDSFQVVGNSRIAEPNVQHGFLWEDGVMTDLGDFGFSGDSEAWSINNHGTVVGRARAANLETHNFVYEGDGLIDTGTGGGRFSLAYQILDDGTSVGYSETSDSREEIRFEDMEFHAFIFGNEGVVDLGTLGGDSFGVSINVHGQVTGNFDSSDGKAHAFLYEDGSMMDLGTFQDENTYPHAINNDGWVIGGTRDGAFLYMDDSFHDLTSLLVDNDDSQWILRHAYDINEAGQIVGTAVHDGRDTAFLLTPVVPGDTNFDGMVDAADLNELALNWRSTDAEGWGQGDFNDDGLVNAVDLNELALNWQFGADPAAGTHAVPEPSGIVLLLISLVIFCHSTRPMRR